MEVHKPPRFDTYGNQLLHSNPVQIPDAKCPPEWIHEPKVKTYQDVRARLRAERLGDPSFDLDGDGVVGGQDFMLASRFDEDKDGRLNTAELGKARKAIDEGYSDQFLWGCDRSGIMRPFRIVQFRGKIIKDECFNSIAETYPEVKRPTPKHESKTALREFRSKEKQDRAAELQDKLLAKWPQRVPNKYTPWEGYVKDPKYSTMSDIKKTLRNTSRMKQGLTQEEDEQPQLLRYVQRPEVVTLSDLKVDRRSKLVTTMQVKALDSSIDRGHKTFTERLTLDQSKGERTGELPVVKTYKDRVEDHKKALTADLQMKFSNRPVGIHGKELPKFAEHCPEYWKRSGTLLDTSQRSMLQTRKLG